MCFRIYTILPHTSTCGEVYFVPFFIFSISSLLTYSSALLFMYSDLSSEISFTNSLDFFSSSSSSHLNYLQIDFPLTNLMKVNPRIPPFGLFFLGLLLPGWFSFGLLPSGFLLRKLLLLC